MKRSASVVLMLASLGCGIVAPSVAGASWMTSFEGHSVFSVSDGRPGSTVCKSCDSTVSFRVYKNESGDNWINDLGLMSVVTDLWPKVPTSDNGHPTTTGNERYIYFYFINNTSPISGKNDQPIESFSISYAEHLAETTQPSKPPYLSGGILPNLIFSGYSQDTSPGDIPDNGKLETDSCEKESTNCVGNFHVGPPDSDPPIAPAKLSTAITSTSGVNAGKVSYDAMRWEWTKSDGGLINPDDGNSGVTYSTVLFLTSDLAPIYRWADTVAPGTNGTAGDVVAAPEPNSLALVALGTGVLFLITGLGRRSCGCI